MGISRRNFMKTSAVATLAAGVQTSSWAAPRAARASGKPRNVILLVSDGMSSGTLSIADQFLRWRDGRPSHWMALYEQNQASRGLMETASANSIVTDSAAASSAWGCGRRVRNYVLNMGPDNEPWEPILVTARQAGKGTGVVTTATVTHATPAGFIANVDSRDEEIIAAQYVEREIDVMLGGGTHRFDASRRDDGRDLLADLQKAGYPYAITTAEMQAEAAQAERLLGFFSTWFLPFEIDRLNHAHGAQERVPSLAEMSQAALQVLNRNPAGFILQIEGARVDHAAHANDISGLIFDQIAFDDAIKVALDFAAEVPDTLVIITTDHGNANPGLSSGGSGGDRNFTVLNSFKASQRNILRRLEADQTPEEIQQHILELTGIEWTDEQATIMLRSLNDDLPVAYNRMNSNRAILGQLLANDTDIGWVGNDHTSDHVELAAIGPGQEAVQAFTRNTDLHALMMSAL